LPARGEDKVRLERQTFSGLRRVENLDQDSDAVLLRRALAGDEPAFIMLYEHLKGSIFRYAYYMTNSRTVAEEVAQEVFIQLLKQGGRYREECGDVGAFAFGIARNFVRRIERRERPYEPIPDDASMAKLPASLVSEPESLARELMRNEVTARVQSAIASLPDHYRQAVVLCDLCELSYEQAASRLQCAVGTIRSRLNRAHAILAQKLQPLRRSQPDIRAAGPEGCLI
jgi:RNA polymerase sigma-70 factor (ECF subfamily)